MKHAVWSLLVHLLARWPRGLDAVRGLVRAAAPTTTALLDFPVDARPRWGYGQPPHPQLYAIINRNASSYATRLHSLQQFREQFLRIPLSSHDPQSVGPVWINPFFPSLDAAALYGFLALGNPERYVEIGSGNSTKFARRAIEDHGLRTRITSIDPAPRAEVERICDRAMRRPVETIDLRVCSGDLADRLNGASVRGEAAPRVAGHTRRARKTVQTLAGLDVQVVLVPELVAAARAADPDGLRVAQRFRVVLPTGHHPGRGGPGWCKQGRPNPPYLPWVRPIDSRKR